MLKSLLMLTLVTLLSGCLVEGECGASASCPAPPPPMTAEVTDNPGAELVQGALNFYEVDATDAVDLGASGAWLHMGVHLSRPVAADLVAGRLVELPPSAGGWSQNAVYRIGARDVLREIRSLQLTVEADASVTVVAQLGPAEWDSVPLTDLPSTATMTIRGPLRLGCSFMLSDGAMQSDPEFRSSFCAGLRTELRLDALVARSLRL